MKHIIIGTAGHIDHGKTTLIKALTGCNTDRFEEEQRRGITIDLGFTHFDLKNGNRVGIIDVPGHEKFINNMVAGVVGMDMVMLVIAADEGIMPQTREHIDILAQLGVKKSILVLNKCDLVDEEWLMLVEEEIREELKGTFLSDAPLVKISAVTGEGVPELIELIERLTEEEVEEKDIHTIPRLPVDRVFSMSGFGTIITGTLVSGTLTKDASLMMYPIGKECKIRSIQVHGEDVKECYAGQRVAINISNIKKNEISRGCVLAPPNNMKNTNLLDVKLNVLETAQRIITNKTRLHFFTGTSEILCRALLLDKDEIGPGESGYVQLLLEEEIALRRGDRFIVRFYSPMETIGGGVVLEPNPTKKRRFQQDVIEALKQKESGSSQDVVDLHVKDCGRRMVTTIELAKLTALTVEEIEKDVRELEAEQKVLFFSMKKDTYVWNRASEAKCRREIIEALAKYEQKYPYRYGLAKAEIRMTFLKEAKQNVFDLYIDMLVEEGAVKRYDEFLALPEFTICRDEAYHSITKKILEPIKKAEFDFLRLSDMDFGTISKGTIDDILLLLIDDGQIVKVTEDTYTLTEYMNQAKEIIVGKLKENGKITIAEIRDLFHTSRKSAKPILEYMDSIRVTKKTGAESERVAN